MENSISYFAGGKQFIFSTQLKFGDQTYEQVARRVFISVSHDRDERLLNGEIPSSLSDGEQQSMTDAEILDWFCITKIEYIDYSSIKRLTMHHMSDFLGKFKVEPLK